MGSTAHNEGDRPVVPDEVANGLEVLEASTSSSMGV